MAGAGVGCAVVRTAYALSEREREDPLGAGELEGFGSLGSGEDSGSESCGVGGVDCALELPIEYLWPPLERRTKWPLSSNS